MKWKVILGLLLIVLFAQSPALAPTHYSMYYTVKPGIAQPLVDYGRFWISVIVVSALILVQTGIVARLLAAPATRALFFSVTSVLATLTVGDYVFAFLFGVSEAEGAFQLIFLTVMNAVFLVGLLIWSAPWVFGKSVSWTEGLRVLAIPILLPTLWGALHHLAGLS
jgi:hypothetical protein